MSKISKKSPDKACKPKSFGNHKNYLSRITKTLYYGRLPKAEALSLPVTELAAELFSEVQKGKSLERLHYNDAAEISRNACISPCSLVLAMLYLERLKTRNPEYLDKTAPSDLFLVSLMVSCKFLFDDGESDEAFIDEWAASGGISVKELVHLEKNFLKAIDWEIYVSELNFWKKLTEIETTVAARQGCLRGYFTYTELQNLASTIELRNLIHCFVAVSVILATVYTAGLLTLVGSVYLVSHVPGTNLYNKKLEIESNNVVPMPNEVGLIEEAKIIKTDLRYKHGKNMDIVNVLKTSILLASIKTPTSVNETQTEYINSDANNENIQYVSWDYWNVPIMDWLSKSSQFVSNFTLDVGVKYYNYFLETSVAKSKCFKLEDTVNKATKTRIQDQMESSWHKEWTDVFKYGLFYKEMYSCYLQGVKS
ncbi:hypothetical protein NQ315_017243 [Exocentrus adspersus]|uniref:Protein CNPPD1 n=1 Tax=Exocentrus adspersus TaxID=1586481 RepID=A0AAV8VFE4_9CUCU|nr:hypothetical protein NQ315_017243 [Exocentrus adspersus]